MNKGKRFYLFVADAHIKDIHDENQILLVDLLNEYNKDINSLFLVGDIFDFWCGRSSSISPRYIPLLNKLLELRDNGTSLLYLEGNHDFFMGPFFTEMLNAVVFKRFCEIELKGKRIYVTHGDIGNGMDRGYRILRRVLRMRTTNLIVNNIPPWLVEKVAFKFSSYSEKRARFYEPVIKERLRGYARRKWDCGYDVVIMGHSHMTDLLEEKKKGRLYINIGDWLKRRMFLLYDCDNDCFITCLRVKGKNREVRRIYI